MNLVDIDGLPLVSVVTTVFKKRDTITDCIESICLQTYPKIEIIVVDDGPNSVEDCQVSRIVNEKSVISFKIIHNNSNMGTSFSLNEGIKASKGEYIINISDDDCFYDSAVVADLVSEFLKTGAEIITCKRAVFDSTLSHFYGIDPDPNIVSRIKESEPQQLFEIMAGYNYVLGCVTVKKREILDRYPYDPTYRIIEDYPIVMRMLRDEVSIYFFDRVIIKYREGGVSSVQNIDDAYFRESEYIFKKEILPYVHRKLVAIIHYRRWKRNVMKCKKVNSHNKQK